MEALFSIVQNQGRPFVIGFLFLFIFIETVNPFFHFFKSKPKERLSHGGKNLLLGLINIIALSFIFVGLWHEAASFAFRNNFGFLYRLSLPIAFKAMIAVMLLDLWTYAWHRMNHEVPFFWKFHKVHHSDTQMDVSTAFRFHFGEIILSSLLRIPVILLIGAELWHVALYEAIMFPFVQLQHANVSLPPKLDAILRIFFATPNMHKIHHSNVQKETDSNYTSFLSIWDRLFGSFFIKENLDTISFGINKKSKPRNILQLIIDPIKK